MDKQEIKKRLKNSLDVAYLKRLMVVYGLTITLGALVWMLRMGDIRDSGQWILSIAVSAALFIPIPVICLLRAVKIFHRLDAYTFCQGKLSQPRSSAHTNAMYFTVLLQDPSGNYFTADTNGIFHTRSLVGPRLEDYINRTVTIAYNEATDAVVVIG